MRAYLNNKICIHQNVNGRRLSDRFKDYLIFTRLPDTDLNVSHHLSFPGHTGVDTLVGLWASVILFGLSSAKRRRSFEAKMRYSLLTITGHYTQVTVILRPRLRSLQFLTIKVLIIVRKLKFLFPQLFSSGHKN